MMHLSVVPYIEGDVQDENHLRVEHHHTQGLSYSFVMIDGVKRFVRCTSGVNGDKYRSSNPSIMVHLKPLKHESDEPELHCKDLDTASILRRIQKYWRFPTLSEYVFDNPDLGSTPGPRLIKRKEAKLVQRGYVHNPAFDRSRICLTDRGQTLLKHLEVI